MDDQRQNENQGEHDLDIKQRAFEQAAQNYISLFQLDAIPNTHDVKNGQKNVEDCYQDVASLVERRKIVHVIDAGGTIGMKKFKKNDEDPALHPISASILSWFGLNREASKVVNDIGVALTFENLKAIDSSQVDARWTLNLMHAINNALERKNVVGVVVTHGTDTLAYTSAVSVFMFDSWRPIVFTAAQFSLWEHPFGDAPGNLLGAIRAAASHHTEPSIEAVLTSTSVFMNYELFHGARIVKMSASDVASFESPAFPRIGVMRDNVIVIGHRRQREIMYDVAKRLLGYVEVAESDDRVQNELADDGEALEANENQNRTSKKKLAVDVAIQNVAKEGQRDEYECKAIRALMDEDENVTYHSMVSIKYARFWKDHYPVVAMLFVYPDMPEQVVEAIANQGRGLPNAVGIVAFGAGTVPEAVMTYVKSPSGRKMRFAVCSACPTGFVTSAYGAGFHDLDHVALCRDMTPEAVFGKLFANAFHNKLDNWKKAMEANQRGEMTNDHAIQ